MFGGLQKLGKALMLPVAVLPAAALLLRLGASDVLDIPFIMQAGGAIFDNLPLVFAIGVAVGFAFDGGGAAALAGAVGYLTLTKAMVTINKDINMGVLAGIISGILAGQLYNRFHNVKLPDFLGFFGGKRFVPIASAGCSIALALIFGFIWPPIQQAIHGVGNWIVGAGLVGAFAFGALNRLLLPLGLHHVINSLVWFVFGSFTDKAGKVVTGDLSRFFAGDPTAGTFMTGFYPIMMFALPAAALAMYTTARPENRKAVSGILLSVALTSFLTGITEPIEFAFMFLAPALYVAHAILTGAALAVCEALGIHHGFGFSAGAIDYVLNYGLATKPLLLIPIGLGFGAVYYFLFVAMIKALDLPTPGRELAPRGMTASASTDEELMKLAAAYIASLGGAGNISSLDSCITRLRLSVKDGKLVMEEEIRRLGATGIIRPNSTDMQIVVGTKADLIAGAIKRQLKG
ncbi:PTS system, N-acetylglucosamine-specific IIBC component [Thermanaerovibrio velox DSM 12556]|uniref:PTS system, N-acetylglucosamine-specific IIBC component n=1 Tax=Thermanaerovibrio velox DSM 12556 TaxID=926567 RepID=H0UPW1_9BACT|nr:N-acetylglucosamine-specific PTS transporter subunit IIBC [Thermanaerovibrio velox]EHM10670.1 PTS system, N-acetylglucosamine-specific IIBC component [Thermanaerovibrio velox DSM 12556]